MLILQFVIQVYLIIKLASNRCAQSGGEMVPKRYPETMQIAAFAEINKMINSMGLGNEAKGFMAVGKKMFGCVRTCMAKKSGNCDKKMA